MKQVFDQIVKLEGWKAFAIEGSVALLHQDEFTATLVEITKDNDVSVLRIDDEPDPAFDESHAWLIARIIMAAQTGNTHYWDGNSPLLPIAFEQSDLSGLRSLAALVYCWHVALPTLVYGNEEDGYLHHVHFDGSCWMISTTGELELDYILQI